MASPVHPARIHESNTQPVRQGRYVVYWMQQAQRVQHNDALEHAIYLANCHELPLLVVFVLMDDYPEANARHYHFMLQGLQAVREGLQERGIAFSLQRGRMPEALLPLLSDAALLVGDMGYLRHQRQWRAHVAHEAPCYVCYVEADVVVPLEQASNKAEYAARTLRPKIHKQLETFLQPLESQDVKQHANELSYPQQANDSSVALDDVDALVAELKLDHSVPAVPLFQGGTPAALQMLQAFLEQDFADYDAHRNQPQTDNVSHMSKYLHFGHVSPVWLALQIQQADTGQENRDSYLEEVIVRRELAMNFVYYTPDYDSYSCLPDWARKTLEEHKEDPRDPCYSREQLEQAQSHDPYWNAAMREMLHTGYMHNYMRMYWAKKILEWSASPEEAFATTLYLNNRYFIDGRDANSYTGVAWCYGVHDRPWTERAIFGKTRYMNDRGLERKAKPKLYIDKVDALVKRVQSS